jgi:hypothetical protein
MYQISSWEVQTKEILNIVRKKIKEIETENEKRLAPWKQKELSIQDTLSVFSELKGQTAEEMTEVLSKEDVNNKRQKEILILIASRNNGLLIASRAIKAMKNLGVFGNPENGASAVYSVLKRADEFEKVGQGTYRLRNFVSHNEGFAQLTEVKPSARERRVISGVQQAVREIKEQKPELTKEQVLNILVNKKFDFKGKKPKNSVNMAWSHLGYSRRNSEQPVLIANQP